MSDVKMGAGSLLKLIGNEMTACVKSAVFDTPGSNELANFQVKKTKTERPFRRRLLCSTKSKNKAALISGGLLKLLMSRLVAPPSGVRRG